MGRFRRPPLSESGLSGGCTDRPRRKAPQAAGDFESWPFRP